MKGGRESPPARQAQLKGGGESPPARQAQHEVEDLLARAPEPLVEELRRNLIDVVVRRRFWVYEIILRKRSSR